MLATRRLSSSPRRSRTLPSTAGRPIRVFSESSLAADRRSMRDRLIRALLVVVTATTRLTAQADIGPGATRDAAIEHPYRPGVDVQSYDLTLDLPKSGNVINGYAVLEVRHTTRVDTLVLDLLQLTVDSVKMDGVRVAFARTPGEIHVAFRPNGKFP